jgi:hypothetical protein
MKNGTARKLVSVGSKDVRVPMAGFLKPKDLKKGQIIKGTYEGSFVSGDYNGTTYRIKLEEGINVTSKGETVAAKAGETIGLSDCSALKDILPLVNKGAYVEITYNGKVKKTGKKGAYTQHLLDVVAEEGSIKAAGEADVADEETEEETFEAF